MRAAPRDLTTPPPEGHSTTPELLEEMYLLSTKKKKKAGEEMQIAHQNVRKYTRPGNNPASNIPNRNQMAVKEP